MRSNPQIIMAASTAQQVYDWLRMRVLRGELAPGTRVSESEVSTQIGVSRQPVREAFIRLAANGLAEVRPQRGTYIAAISLSAVLSARLIREAVESDLIRMVAAAPSEALCTTLRRQLDAQREASARQDVEAFDELDDLFHRALAVAAGQEHVWTVLDELKSQMNRLRHITVRVFDQQKLIEQHRAIVEAVCAGNPDAAEQAMRRHLRELLNDLPEIARSHPEFFTT
ncbi:GntR family transcriptional regulator [Paracoccus spongiarum]|uniref:GntR family transcriptional regulator n=1 Tax=Paracoccus spongiarum TaxID=3064387 RepID=A0ABT9JFV5_9RHOB|nr:GntR family transcriptional regulator [Paracoccus sp. 2205BS29-5]MDP5308697.1 GntR family transcriptional regulator [Paracoccus sp. 2205BS29-5]